MNGLNDNNLHINKQKLCLIGAGNVAWHLAHSLQHVVDIIQIYSHSIENAETLGTSLNNRPLTTDNLNNIVTDADIYIVSIKDDYIKQVAEATPTNGIWCHTSGTIPMTVFQGLKDKYGVFYPLQTFSKTSHVDISSVPFFIEGCNESVTDSLTALAHSISTKVMNADSDRRKAIHIAAVFACNFTNYMWTLADEYLKSNDLDFDILQPLLRETLKKTENIVPRQAQTGPARRGDCGVINAHLAQLNGNSHEVYKLLSQLLLNEYHHEQNQL